VIIPAARSRDTLAIMSTLALQISLRCGACGVVVPVNGLVNDVVCWSCDKHTPLDSTIWGMIFEQPLSEAKTLSPQVQRAGTLTTDIGTIHRVYHTGAPHCGGCQAALDASVFVAAVGHAPTVPCPSCRQGVTVRAAPPELAAKGVVGIAAETEGVKKKREPVPLACTSCGGSLNVDGSTKLVTCPFCNNQQYLPNELLLALRATPVRPWSLLMSDGAVAAPQKTLATWQTVGDVVADANGNLYLWGLSLDTQAPRKAKTPEEKRAMLAAMLGGALDGGGDANTGESLFCMAPDLTLKWKLDGLPFGAGTKLAFARSGHLIIRNGDHAEVRRCDTGALVLRFSGNQGEGGRLGLNFMSQLVVDADGTLVAYTFDDELLRRFDATGHPIAMWGMGPPRDHSREVAADPWGPFVFQLKNQPSRVHSVLLAVGWDGGLYLQSSLKMEGASHLAAFDRSGKHLYTAQIPVQAPGFEARPTIDGYGRAYVLLPNDGGTVYRVEAWGRNVVPFARTPSSGADLLGGGTFMACTPDGSLYLVSGGGVLRRLSPDGRVAFLSPGAIAADQRRGDVF
jgi:outer membrane protein assembly factor BamB